MGGQWTYHSFFHTWYWILLIRGEQSCGGHRSNAFGGSYHIGGGGANNILVSCDGGLLSDFLGVGKIPEEWAASVFVHVYSLSMELYF